MAGNGGARKPCPTAPNSRPSPPASKPPWTWRRSSASFTNSGSSPRNRRRTRRNARSPGPACSISSCSAETEAEAAHASEVVSTLTSHHPCRAIVLSVAVERIASRIVRLDLRPLPSCRHRAETGVLRADRHSCERPERRAPRLGGVAIAGIGSPDDCLVAGQLPDANRSVSPPRRRGRPGDLRHLGLAESAIAIGRSRARPHRAYPRCSFTDLSWTRLGIVAQTRCGVFRRAALLRRIGADSRHGHRARSRAGRWLARVAVRLLVRGPTPMAAAEARTRIHLSERDDRMRPRWGSCPSPSKRATQHSPSARIIGESTASATVDMPNACGLPRKRAFWPADDASLLSQELDNPARDPVYGKALAIAAALLENDRR